VEDRPANDFLLPINVPPLIQVNQNWLYNPVDIVEEFIEVERTMQTVMIRSNLLAYMLFEAYRTAKLANPRLTERSYLISTVGLDLLGKAKKILLTGKQIRVLVDRIGNDLLGDWNFMNLPFYDIPLAQLQNEFLQQK
jgi:hypothetical protein